MDLILDELKISGLDFATVKAISGSGQQHGSVYWKNGARGKLKNLSSNKFLHVELQDAFALRDSPIWMDSSTTEYCKNLEEALGGAQELANITGSRAYERFTASQIAKIYDTRPDVYDMTERISLVSNFMASLFIGDYAPIDLSDGSGMNLLDIWKREWSEKCLNFCAPDLGNKLGEKLVPSNEIVGPISDYFVQRYGFDKDCKVSAFTGDNPASLVGMHLNEGDIGISLGTSDTVFLWLKYPKPAKIGHIFVNPLCADYYMSLLCFKNGSLTRERIRNECAEGDWNLFNELVESTPRGNFGNIAFYFDSTEIYPPIKGDFRFNKFNEKVSSYSKEVEARSCLEGQFLRLRLHADLLGYSNNNDQNAVIRVTGGASNNTTILQIISDVFNRPVYRQKIANSACFGGALLAKYGKKRANLLSSIINFYPLCNLAMCKEKMSFKEMTCNLKADIKVCDPSSDAESIYLPMLKRYEDLENQIATL